ncbi:MAG TPA: MFS transporter [Candidatus Limnocylindria bacterium]|nr:MFS transporter [Candidatus Limnocylindria bacterium]
MGALTNAARQVLRNHDLRRALIAWMLGWAAETAWLVALLVYAYQASGVAAVGAVALARTLPAGLLAPALSTLADRLARHRVLLAVHLGRSVLLALAALSAASGLPPLVVFGLAPFDGLLAVLHRPTHVALMPALARSPEDLVASNAASGAGEGIGTLVGPAVGGALLALAAPGAGFAVPALLFGLSGLVVAGIQPSQALRATPRRTGLGELLLGGARALVTYRSAGLILLLFFAQITVRGLLSVLLVVASVELLRVGEAGVGYLNSAIGIGGFLGALGAMALVGRSRQALVFAVALVVWGVPILLIGLLPQPILAAVLLATLGVGNAVLDVAGFTIVQRTTPNAVRGRVFGMLEALVMVGLAIGSALAPILVVWLGTAGALVATGAILPVCAALSWRWVSRVDAAAVIPARQMELLRRVPMLASLPMTVLEQVAGDLEPVGFAAGEAIIRQGEIGDRFYILATGRAEASIDGRSVRLMGIGDSFGEIALLRDVARTATVTALEPVAAMALRREAFLTAVTGDWQSHQAADRVVSERLAS